MSNTRKATIRLLAVIDEMSDTQERERLHGLVADCRREGYDHGYATGKRCGETENKALRAQVRVYEERVPLRADVFCAALTGLLAGGESDKGRSAMEVIETAKRYSDEAHKLL